MGAVQGICLANGKEIPCEYKDFVNHFKAKGLTDLEIIAKIQIDSKYWSERYKLRRRSHALQGIWMAGIGWLLIFMSRLSPEEVSKFTLIIAALYLILLPAATIGMYMVDRQISKLDSIRQIEINKD